MNTQTKNRILRIFILSIVALIIGAGVAYYQVRFQTAHVRGQDSASKGASPIAGLEIGGPFSLTNHLGEAVTQETYADQYKLIYFGFTFCPAICPTELQKVSRVMKALEKNKPEIAAQFQPLFITIDPTRDTVPVMKDYVSLFHPKIIGLTGTQPQIDFVTKAYRIFARKVEDPDSDNPAEDYTMDHSSYLYLMGPEGNLLGLYRMDDDADYIYDDVVLRTAS
ncbi:MAG: SCO family protein [Alphaproteobacteria bacterium]|nr:SCO family protein [Alphaproteobacteria bacterium]